MYKILKVWIGVLNFQIVSHIASTKMAQMVND